MKQTTYFTFFLSLFLFSQVSQISQAHAEEGLVWTEVVAKSNHFNAPEICENLGGRLPTIREAVAFLYSPSQILEVADEFKNQNIDLPHVEKEIKEKIKQLLIPVYKFNNDSEIVLDFFYNPNGYVKNLDSNDYFIWTSSLDPSYVDYATGDLSHAYTFDYRHGTVLSNWRKSGRTDDPLMSVRCIVHN